MKKGKYYIGDVSYILNFNDFSDVLKAEFGEIYELKNGVKFEKFHLAVGDYKDNQGFIYSVDSEIFGIIESSIINIEFLSEKILTVKNDVLYDKTTNYARAKIVTFNSDFSVFRSENSLNFADIEIFA